MERFERQSLVFDVSDTGDPGGEAVILLHGFPANRDEWAPVAEQLVERGYRVLAPDQRGYSPGARPRGRRQYGLSECVDDVLALADAAGVQRFHLVGHDWGGAVAWAAAYLKPERLLSLAVLATPHPRAMLRSMVTSTQALRSSYMVLFQLPAVPERMMLAIGGAPLRRQLESSGLPPAFAASYVAQLREPGALTAALNWYRAMPLTAGFAAVGRIGVPTLYMWGSRDGFLGAAAAQGTRRWIDGPYRYMELDGVSHWIPETEPTLVATALAEHFSTAAKD